MAKRFETEEVDRGLHEKVYVLVGVSPLNSERIILQYKGKNLLGTYIPDALTDRIIQAKAPHEEGIEVRIEQIEELKEVKGIHGIHVMGST